MIRSRTGNRRASFRSGTFDGTPVRPPNPLHIFGSSRLPFWLRPEQFTAASWPDATGNLTLAQATAAQQLEAATGINGRSTAYADGDDYMVGDMATPIVAGSRPTIFGVVRVTQDAASGDKIFLFLSSVSAALSMNALFYGTVSGARRYRFLRVESPASSTTWRGEVVDTRAHLLESSWPSSTTGHFYSDGTEPTLTLGTPSSEALPYQAGRIEIANNSGLSVGSTAHFGDIFCALDATAEERAQVHEWIEWKWGITLP